MNKIKEKLKSKKGVSFLFALIAFIVASAVAVTIVTAAVTGVNRVNDDRKATQTHMTLTSAAEMVRDIMKDTEITCARKADGTIDFPNAASSGTNALLFKELVSALEEIEKGNTFISGGKEGNGFVIQVPGMEDVLVTYVMQSGSVAEGVGASKYKLIFTFTIDGNDEAVYLSMVGNCDATRENGKLFYSWSASTAYINGLGQ